MDSNEAFDRLDENIRTNPLAVLLAKWNRDSMIAALLKIPGVIAVVPSGSLARGTHIGPLHDIDLIVIVDRSWIGGSGSAELALQRLRDAIVAQLGGGPGSESSLVEKAEPRNHVVRCDLDISLGWLDDLIPSVPPFDIMPAVREGSHLLVPEKRNDRWVDVDPENLIRLVQDRQREWAYFERSVRMFRAFAQHANLNLKSVAVELIVLTHMPRPRWFETLSLGEAFTRCLESAAKRGISDLNYQGRAIDPDMNYGALNRALKVGAEEAREAVKAELAWENRRDATADVTHPSCHWKKLFGKDYPEAWRRVWRVPRLRTPRPHLPAPAVDHESPIPPPESRMWDEPGPSWYRDPPGPASPWDRPPSPAAAGPEEELWRAWPTPSQSWDDVITEVRQGTPPDGPVVFG